MCGIAGLFGIEDSSKRKDSIGKITSGLSHRGPDGNGVFEIAEGALIHTRLSIIDLSANGNQPLFSEDRSITLVCNGEIYNYLEIRNELIAKGHIFSSKSDSEIIIHLYEECKGDVKYLLGRLTGMFAFALWDSNKKELTIARDRVGIKPLYYAHQSGTISFASEVKPLAISGVVTATVDYTSLYEYFLTGSIPSPNTLYNEIKCLPPGHYLTYKNGGINITEYWDIPKGLRNWKNFDEAKGEVRTLVSEIIKDHLVADVPVGTFLSAGVDSSLITAIAVEHHPGIHSFTASFPGEPEDEGIIADETAKKLKTTHHSFEIKNDFFQDFSDQFQDIDQPFAISSALSLGRISKLARQYVKVVLSGDGGDELFGGYSRYEPMAKPAFLNKIPEPLHDTFLKYASLITGRQDLKNLRNNIKITDADRFFSKVVILSPEKALSFFAEDVKPKIDQDRYLRNIRALFEKRTGEDALNRILYVDMKTTLVDEMLTKCDRMTMLNGIEGRVPFLDHRLVELAFEIPGSYKRQNNVGKIILRDLLAEKLGRDLAYRVKTGFNSPLAQWLSKDEKTRNFVKHEIQDTENLTFIDRQKMKSMAHNPAEYVASSVFAVVCLSQYVNSRADTTVDV